MTTSRHDDFLSPDGSQANGLRYRISSPMRPDSSKQTAGHETPQAVYRAQSPMNSSPSREGGSKDDRSALNPQEQTGPVASNDSACAQAMDGSAASAAECLMCCGAMHQPHEE